MSALACELLHLAAVRHLTLILVLTLVVLASGEAVADDVVSEFENRPTALYFQLGLGTLLGLVGIEVEHVVSPTWAVSVGGGLGQAGPQVAAMIRQLWGGDRSKFVLGAGLAAGRYTW